MQFQDLLNEGSLDGGVTANEKLKKLFYSVYDGTSDTKDLIAKLKKIPKKTAQELQEAYGIIIKDEIEIFKKIDSEADKSKLGKWL